ncbi:hypothetical protein F2Q69_00005316 [Brassica cretica]|uniref:Uncharacterized protein n=1 Tax=Brassica cretica TaxID=69181 RepID=A0A8S9PFM4_BRACR|nr:hypothetical protein F2Q69_00005316 [Brassica cretica]
MLPEMQIDVLANRWDAESGFALPSSSESRIDTLWMSEAGIVDTFFFVGPEPKDVVKQYASVTGTSAMPQLFATGYHQCKWNYKDEEDVAQVDSKFHEHDIPYDVLWLDIEHTDGKRYFTWDSALFPSPEEMQKKLAAKGRRMVTIVDSHIKRDDSYHSSGKDFDGWCWPGSSSYIDMLSPEIREWWGGRFSYKKYVGSTPSLYIWNDMYEPSVFNVPERELQDIVRILKNDEEFQNKGIYCSKVVLLHGPPATGKTLMSLNDSLLDEYYITRRFDKFIRVGLPSKDGRLAILKVHARNKFFRSEDEKDELLQEVAENTQDFTGAELQNVLNEAGILTARKDLDYIGREELLEALKRQKGTFETGQEDSTEVPEELKLRLAYREASVARLACYLPDQYRPISETYINSIRSQPNMRYTESPGRVYARRGGIDEPFAWESRESLKKLCIGKELLSKWTTKWKLLLEDNLAFSHLSDMVEKCRYYGQVREQGRQNQDKVSPYISELLQLEELAKQEGLGRRSKVGVFLLLPLGILGIFDAMGLLAASKGKHIEAFVEQVRDGSAIRVYLLPELQFVQVSLLDSRLHRWEGDLRKKLLWRQMLHQLQMELSLVIVNAPRGAVQSSPDDKFQVFYIDYGNQETVRYSAVHPIEPSVVVEERDTSGGKVKGQGTGTELAVDDEIYVNAAMSQEEGVEKRYSRVCPPVINGGGSKEGTEKHRLEDFLYLGVVDDVLV